MPTKPKAKKPAEKKDEKKPGAEQSMAPAIDPDQKLWDQVAFNEWKDLANFGKYRNNPEERAEESAYRADCFMEARELSKGKFSEKKDGAPGEN